LHSVLDVQQLTTLINITTICTIPIAPHCHFLLVDGCELSGVSTELRITSIKWLLGHTVYLFSSWCLKSVHQKIHQKICLRGCLYDEAYTFHYLIYFVHFQDVVSHRKKKISRKLVTHMKPYFCDHCVSVKIVTLGGEDVASFNRMGKRLHCPRIIIV
jgi:hypothetical protein